MSGILQAWFGAMLIGVPISFLFAVRFCVTQAREGVDVPLSAFPAIWAWAYSVVLLFAAVFFAGGVGAAMLLGAL